jgi:hypothetical protein
MSRPVRVAVACVVVALSACDGPGDSRTATPFDESARRAVYDRTDLDFEAGILYKPAEGTVDGKAWTFAPLLIQEVPRPDSVGLDQPSAPTVVYYRESSTRIGGRDYSQWSYVWSYPDAESVQGIRLTVGADGFPAVYEVLHDSSGARLLFVADVLEQEARETFGARLPGRRFTVEREVEQTPDVVVGGTLESGPTPLGPFVYVWEGSRDVNTVICRCMPSRVVSIPTTATYDLEPLDPSAAPATLRELLRERAPAVEQVLRRTGETLRGSPN